MLERQIYIQRKRIREREREGESCVMRICWRMDFVGLADWPPMYNTTDCWHYTSTFLMFFFFFYSWYLVLVDRPRPMDATNQPINPGGVYVKNTECKIQPLLFNFNDTITTLIPLACVLAWFNIVLKYFYTYFYIFQCEFFFFF